LQEKYNLTKQKRLEIFAEQFEKIKEELNNRDLSQIPTDKLFGLLIQFNECWKKEMGQPTFSIKTKKNILETIMEDSVEIETWQA